MATDAAGRARSLAEIAVLGLLLAGCAGGGPGAADRIGSGSYVVGSPYEENGVWYYPAVDYNYDKTGIASWYGADFDGRSTANGEIYDMNALTAAHPTLPLPSIVQITDLQNGRSLQLRVNDRGPFVDGRLIDVSRRAAQLLGFETRGTAPVRVRILKDESIAVAEQAMRNGGETVLAAAVPPVPAPVATAPSPAPSAVVRSPTAPSVIVATGNAAPEKPPNSSNLAVGVDRRSGRLYVQAGAFSMQDNAQRVRSRIARFGDAEVTPVLVDGIEMYRVRVGPVETADEADSLLARVVGSGYSGARIVGD